MTTQPRMYRLIRQTVDPTNRPSSTGSSRSSFLIPALRRFRSPSAEKEGDPMNTEELFSDSAYTDRMHMAEDELSAFIRAVRELYGPAEATLSVEDWLEEADLIDSPPLSTSRDWRAVTIAASARLASRLSVELHQPTRLAPPTDTKVSPIPSSNCFPSKFVA